jgi:hypothetical protein
MINEKFSIKLIPSYEKSNLSIGTRNKAFVVIRKDQGEFFLNKNVLFKVEAEHIQYEKMNIPSGNTVTSSGGGNLKPSSNNLTISVGYQF